MKKAEVGVVVAFIAIAALATNTIIGSDTAASSPIPPKNLKLVGDHWTPWDPPPAGPDAYIIQKGDCLWNLAGKWLDDPYLWPQIWEENRYILDSHWIYPGDPLVVPGRPTVVPPEGPPETAEIDAPVERVVDQGYGRGQDEQGEETEGEPEPLPLLPVADAVDLYCSGYIDPEPEVTGISVIGAELEREGLGQGDVLYINQGENQGIQPGEELAVRRLTRTVQHPSTGEELGTYVRRLGKIRILAVQDETSTALVEESCEDIRIGDILAPWDEIPVPMMTGMPPFDRYDVEPTGGSLGVIVAIKDDIVSAGGGQVIYADLGRNTEAKPGDVLNLFRDNGDLPRLMIGQAVILTVEPSSSTAKITLSVRETAVGDNVEIRRCRSLPAPDLVGRGNHIDSNLFLRMRI